MDITKKFEAGFRKLALAGAVSLALLVTACGEESESTEFQNHLDRAQAYQEQGQYKAATIEYRNALKKSQRSPEVLLQFASMLNDVGDHQSARNFLEAVQLDSERYYLEITETYIALGKLATAQETLALLKSSTREKMLLEAELAVKQGDLNSAERRYASLLKNSPTDDRVLHGMATVDALRGNYDAALEGIAKVSKTDKSYPKTQLLKAGIEITRDELELAEGTLSELLSVLPSSDQMLPDRVVTLQRLSYVLTRLGRPNEAYLYTKLLSDAFPGATQANDQLQAAMEDFQKGRLDEAKSKLEAIVAEFPGHRRSREVLGVISYMQGDNETAAKLLNDVVDPETTNPLATQVYMAANLRLNEPERVLQALEPTIEKQTSTELLSLYGLAAISDKQYEKGENALLKAEKLEPENTRVLLALASFYRVAPNVDKAQELTYLLKAKKAQPAQQQVLVEMASYYSRKGQQDKAEKMLKDTAEAHANTYAPNLVAGQYLALSRKLDESNKYLNRALKQAETGGQKFTVGTALARNALMEGKNDEAINGFNQLIEMAPKNVQAYIGLHAAVSQAEGKDAAIARLESVAKDKKTMAAYQALIRTSLGEYNVARAQRAYENASQDLEGEEEQLVQIKSVIDYFQALDYLKTGQLEKAKESAAKSLIESPGNLRVVAVLAEVEVKTGNLGEAERLLARLSSEGAALGHIVPALQGDLAMAKENVDEARSYYEQAWTLSKTPGIAEKLHRVLVKVGDAKARKEFVLDWNRSLPENPLAMLLVAMDYQGDGNAKDAAIMYEKLLEQRPDSVAALNNLGWIYFERRDDRALVLLEKAADLAPNSAAVLDSYGWVLHKFGKTQQGLKYLEKAVELKPDNEEIVAHYEEAKKAG